MRVLVIVNSRIYFQLQKKKEFVNIVNCRIKYLFENLFIFVFIIFKSLKLQK